MTELNRNFIAALNRKTQKTPPIWIMRQAGRYLPEYRAVRSNFKNFLDMCKTPEVCCELVLQPIERYDFDAAIIFSDILTIPDALGLGVSFVEGKGPIFSNPIKRPEDISDMKNFNPDSLEYVYKTAELTRKELDQNIPLIGFAGSPWTLAAYSIEGSSSKNFDLTKSFIESHSDDAHKFLDILSDACFEYLKRQIISGVDAVQIFDSWANLLSEEQYLEYSLKYIKKILKKLSEDPVTSKTPTIVFARDPKCSLSEFQLDDLSCYGMFTSINPNNAISVFEGSHALQGNLDPKILLEEDSVIKESASRILSDFKDYPGYIFNLGHGITPDINPDKVKVLVEAIRDSGS